MKTSNIKGELTFKYRWCNLFLQQNCGMLCEYLEIEKNNLIKATFWDVGLLSFGWELMARLECWTPLWFGLL